MLAIYNKKTKKGSKKRLVKDNQRLSKEEKYKKRQYACELQRNISEEEKNRI